MATTSIAHSLLNWGWETDMTVDNDQLILTAYNIFPKEFRRRPLEQFIQWCEIKILLKTLNVQIFFQYLSI
jgi:hypothetical protein